jgi:hypothetical protein
MAPFSNSFTGKDVYRPLPPSDTILKGQERLSDLMLNAEKMKFDTFKENEKEFQKNINIDPVMLLNDKAMKVQSDLINQYNQKFGGLLKKRGGVLTEEDKIIMAREKTNVIMQQNKMQADMNRYLTDREYVTKSGKIDAQKWQEEFEQPFLRSGNYPVAPLPPIPLFLTDYAGTIVNKFTTGKKTIEDNPITVGGVPYIERTTYMAEKGDVVPIIKNRVFNNDQYMAGVFKEWSDLSEQD